MGTTLLGGIILKGLNGIFELICGALLLLVDLNEDPNDGVARFLVHSSGSLTGRAMLFSSICLLTHGLVKVVRVVAVLKNKLWAYPWMIAAGFHRVSAVPNRTSGQRGDDRTDNSSTSSLLP